MHAQNIFLRILKFLGKAILGLLLILLTVVALIHLPPLQIQVTRALSNYLSTKIQARVEIQRINFSVLGNVAIDDLRVWDPDNNKIFSAREIEVKSNIFDLVTGDLVFDKIRIAGVSGQLIQGKEGLNIQFILDAFNPAETGSPKSNEVKIQLNKILLENIAFEFTSSVNGIAVTANLGTLMIEEVELLTNPMKIGAEKVNLISTSVNVLSTAHPDTTRNSASSKTNNLLSPDFGTGIAFEVNELEFKNNNFSFHRNAVTNTSKFDPSHLSMKNIKILVFDIIIHKDTLAATLKNLSAELPGFQLADAGAVVRMNHDLFALSGLHLTSGSNDLRADLTGPLELTSAKDGNHAPVEVEVECRVNPGDFSYFFSDTLMNHFNHWGTTELGLEGHYTKRKGEIKALDLKTGNSQFHVQGMLNEVLDVEKINWKDLEIHASIGSAFKKTLTPFLRNINVPPDVMIQYLPAGERWASDLNFWNPVINIAIGYPF